MKVEVCGNLIIKNYNTSWDTIELYSIIEKELSDFFLFDAENIDRADFNYKGVKKNSTYDIASFNFCIRTTSANYKDDFECIINLKKIFEAAAFESDIEIEHINIYEVKLYAFSGMDLMSDTFDKMCGQDE